MFSKAIKERVSNLNIIAGVHGDMIKSQHTHSHERFEDTEKGVLNKDISRNMRSVILLKVLL